MADKIHYPVSVLAGDTIDLDGEKRVVQHAETFHDLNDIARFFGMTLFPRIAECGDTLRIPGALFVIGERRYFASAPQCQKWLETAVGIREIGMVSPRSEDAS